MEEKRLTNETDLLLEGYALLKKVDTQKAKTVFIDCSITVQKVETAEISKCLKIFVKDKAKDMMYAYETPNIISKIVSIVGVADEVIILVPEEDKEKIRLS